MTLSARAAPDEGNWEMRTTAPDAVVSPLRALGLPAASVFPRASNVRIKNRSGASTPRTKLLANRIAAS